MSHLLDDPYLKPFEEAIRGRSAHAYARAKELAGEQKLSDWASAHEYYGLHKTKKGWVFREWAPNATSMWLVGDFSRWQRDPRFECMRIPGSDVWQCEVESSLIKHGDNYRLDIRWEGGRGERIPAYARYVKQVISPKDLALKLLGEPARRQGDALWYKSPFRAEERTASFEVTDISFHDFGTSEHFDVIGFAERYWSCSFKEAVAKP